MDLLKAFDRIPHDILIAQLKAYNFMKMHLFTSIITCSVDHSQCVLTTNIVLSSKCSRVYHKDLFLVQSYLINS